MTIEKENSRVDDEILHNRVRAAESTYYQRLLPVEISDPLNQIKKMEELLRNGGSLLGIFSHKRMSDGPILALVALRNPEIRLRRLLFPIAYHQINSPLKPVIEHYSRTFGVELFPLVIRDTIDKKRYRHLQRGGGVLDYAKSAVRALKGNSAVFLSPQEGRRSTLTYPEVPALGLVVGIAEKSGVNLENVGVLPIDITLKGHDVTPDTGSGFSLFRPSIMTIGEMFLLQDAISQAREQFGDQKDEGVYPIDRWGFSRLGLIVPKWYKSE